MARRLRYAVLVVVAMLSVCSSTVASGVRVVMVVVDAVSAQEFGQARTPFIHSLSRRASIGLMNTKTVLPSFTPPTSSYVSLGAGSRAVGGEEAPYMGANYGELWEGRPVPEVFASRTGTTLLPGNVGMLELSGLLSSNTDEQLEKLRVVPGALGDALHAAGLKTAVLGNADVPGYFRRHIIAIAMDSKGVVDFGDVGAGLTQPDKSSPAGFSTDYAGLLRAFEAVRMKADFCAIELGDSSRAEYLSPHITPEMMVRHRIRAVEKADAFLQHLSGGLDLERTVLMVVSPTPSFEAWGQGDKLTPLWVVGGDFTCGLLTSASTRWPGIVLNADVAPTVLAAFGLAAGTAMIGRPMVSSPRSDSMDDMLSELISTNHGLTVLNEQRSTVLRIFANAEIALLVLMAVAMLGRSRLRDWALRRASGWAVYVASAPLAFLLHAFLPPTALALTVPAVLALILLLGFCSRKVWRSDLSALIGISCITAVTIVGDQLFGQHLAKYSLLSYNPVVGARFYGIGNEYMGVLLGAVVVGSLHYVGVERLRPGRLRGIALVYASAFVAVSHPSLGANFGGSVAAALGLTTTWYLISGRRLGLRTVLLGCLGVGLAGAGLVALDFLRGTEASHLGRLAQAVHSDGLKEIYYVVIRKLDVNIRLVRKTIWSRVVVASFLPVVTLALRDSAVLRAFRARYVTATRALWGTIIVALVAFAANDSGVVAAVTLLIYPTALFVILATGILREQDTVRR